MRIDLGAVPWEPHVGAELRESWHFWDHPRWGFFVRGDRLAEENGAGEELVAFHRHEEVGAHDRGPSLWTYRPLSRAALATLSLPFAEWGEPWRRAYASFRSSTPAWAWALVDGELHVSLAGELSPPVIDDLSWARTMARSLGVDG